MEKIYFISSGVNFDKKEVEILLGNSLIGRRILNYSFLLYLIKPIIPISEYEKF